MKKAEPKRAVPEVDGTPNVTRNYNKNITGLGEKTLFQIMKHFQSALATFSTQQQTQCAQFLNLFKKSKQRYAKMSLPMVHELEHQCDTKYKEIYSLAHTADKQLTELSIEVEKNKKLTNIMQLKK
eukprot:127750_1